VVQKASPVLKVVDRLKYVVVELEKKLLKVCINTTQHCCCCDDAGAAHDLGKIPMHHGVQNKNCFHDDFEGFEKLLNFFSELS
jgi:hypothetical protein